MEQLKMIFENTEVEIVTINKDIMFEVYSIGMALGQVKKNKLGVAYPRKERIDENIKNADIIPCVHNGHTFITEPQLYDLMLEMKTEKVKPFRKWIVNEVIPQIRLTGGYIPVSNLDTDEVIMAKALKIADKTIQEKDIIIRNYEEQINELKPEADMARDIIQSQGLLTLKEVADPMGKYIRSPYFKTVVEENKKTKHLSIVTLVTPKGLRFLYRLIKKNELLDEFDTTLLEVRPNA
jgi:prophage antirepressor-like protein